MQITIENSSWLPLKITIENSNKENFPLLYGSSQSKVENNDYFCVWSPLGT